MDASISQFAPLGANSQLFASIDVFLSALFAVMTPLKLGLRIAFTPLQDQVI